VWNSPQNRSQLTDLASSTSGLHTLSVSKLKTLSVPLPDMQEQAKVVAAINDTRTSSRQLDKEIVRSKVRVRLLWQSALDLAFSGRLTDNFTDDSIEELAIV
jgi:type I restriction enzyme S subunit